MVKIKHQGSAKTFGPRYGRTLKRKLDTIIAQQKKKYKCPYCNYEATKRLSAGIWTCTKCSAKFTGKAYTISK